MQTTTFFGVGVVPLPRRITRAPTTREGSLVVAWAQRRKFYEVATVLQKKNVKGVSPRMAQMLTQNQEYLLIDVRPKPEYAVGRAKGAKSVPMFTTMEGFSAEEVFRRTILGMLGVSQTIENPSFKADLMEAVRGSKGVIFGDNEGGTVEPVPGFPYGKISRSLVAAYVLLEEMGGYSGDVRFVLGGWKGWFEQGLPSEDESGGGGDGGVTAGTAGSSGAAGSATASQPGGNGSSKDEPPFPLL